LEQYYRLNGAVYLCDIERLKEERSFFLKNNCIAYKMEQINSVDIDTEMDFNLAELYLSGKFQRS
jgi:CMP-N-acetylneuraminic acid synthetase